MFEDDNELNQMLNSFDTQINSLKLDLKEHEENKFKKEKEKEQIIKKLQFESKKNGDYSARINDLKKKEEERNKKLIEFCQKYTLSVSGDTSSFGFFFIFYFCY